MRSPPRWSPEELDRERRRAIDLFRVERLEEPLEAYLRHFEKYQDRIEDFLELTVDLTRLGNDPALFGQPERLEILRYLAGPPISADDLKTLADAVSLTAKRFQAEPELVERIVSVVLLGLDRRRFPWVAEEREPNEAERYAAVVATAAMMATQRLGTNRRNEGKANQEQQVEDALLRVGLVKVPRREVRTAAELPARGEFCGESKLGNRKADFILRLWDHRIMPIECKVSNSATNSVKRLNNDAAAKAEVWRRDFGATQVVPCAVLSGVYKLHNLLDAQDRGLVLFWAHRLEDLVGWVVATS
ncbi:MAG TPA: XamI family restriction endonuclease [Longimicrobium sp.]|nr:XamI family restriction endonuclease [Longimicrobium sp.]